MLTCSGCHATFTSLSAFDAHRSGAFTNDHPHYGRVCLSAGAMQGKGYRLDDRGRWFRPMDDETRAKLAAAWGRNKPSE